ncbi:replication-relaxation family protein [Nocardia wallacei]|uniref:replication-relaxation family protein n=1 Tax=Nocardia wallacei TaxID=480035 RepID=UPI0024579E57|nr:replication-relaxation family protein [Nocardia wallacei]
MTGRDVHIAADGAAVGGPDGSAGARRPIAATPNAEDENRNTAGQARIRGKGTESRMNTYSKTRTYSPGGRRRGRGVHRGGHPDAGPWFRLLDRDRRLLALLFEHKAFTTDQIALLEIASVRRAQDRLRKLREMGMLFAFRESLYGGGTSQTRHALGYRGARLIAAQRAQTPPAAAKYALGLERLACSPMLDHRLGVNGFFAALAAHRNPARDPGPAAPDAVRGLTQWWSEHQCAQTFWTNASGKGDLHPDGYGCFEHDDRMVRFFLEYDTGTESLKTVVSKLADYQQFPTDNFGILLFSVHSARRETGLRTALNRALGSYDPGLVIATTSRDMAHPDGPAGPVWAIWTADSGDAPERLRLADLPERGPRITHHASAELPYNEAAFDRDDPLIRNLLHPNQTQPTTPAANAAADDVIELDLPASDGW